MKIGRYDFIIRKKKKYIGIPTSKTALGKWIMKNIVMSKTAKIVISADNESIEIEEIII